MPKKLALAPKSITPITVTGALQDFLELKRRGLLNRSITPEAPGPRYQLALALEGAGDFQGARAALAEALGLGPFPQAAAAREALARLEAVDRS